jgi:hypothetical protein
LVIKGGKVEVLFCTNRMRVTLWPDSAWGASGHQGSETRCRSVDRTMNSDCDRTHKAYVRSGVTYTDICFVAELERTWHRGASSRCRTNTSDLVWAALEPLWMWSDTGKPWGAARPVMRGLGARTWVGVALACPIFFLVRPVVTYRTRKAN